MPKARFRVGAVVFVAGLLLSGIALASEPNIAVIPIVVPDKGNNRVLIYDAPSTDNQPADIVLGQSSSSTSTSGTSATTMSGPTAYAWDRSGNLYVSDTGNCRVLQFIPPFTTGQAATIVLGQPDANTACSGAASATVMGATGGVAVNYFGEVWVADAPNSRLLKFKPPLKTGEAAALVLGQPNFTSASCAAPPTASSLCGPMGVGIDASNYLWVADTQNNRVMRYPAPVKNVNANIEFGHPAATAFTSSTANDGGLSASSLGGPTGVGFDAEGDVWVADTQNSRVLFFPHTYKNGKAALVVIGQTNFTSSQFNQGSLTPTVATLSYPQGIEVDGGGNLWVGDSSNNRTLQFTAPFTVGMNASLVLGQPDFVSNQANQGGSPSDQTQYEPFFQAGPSLIALLVLTGLIGGRHWMLRRQRRAQVRC
jgi:sugar lactone lactonase YvrE